MRTGTILFVRGDSVISKIIRLLDGEYSHIALTVSSNTVLEAQRFTKSRIFRNELENFDSIEITLNQEQESKLTETALELIGFEYDYVQVFSTFFQLISSRFKRKNIKEKYICSELIVDLLYRIKYISDSEALSLMDSTPNELYRFLQDKESKMNVD